MVPRLRSLTPLLAGLIIVGCAPPPTTTTGASQAGSAATAAPVPAKLTVGLSVLVSDLDPHFTIGSNPRRYGLYEALVSQDANSVVGPGLASSWRSLNETTWQFTLAPNRKFHDGSVVTAEDVKWSYDRSLNPANRMGIIARINTIDSVEVVNPTTVNIKTKAPDPLLIKRAVLLDVLSKSYFEKVGQEGFRAKPVGTGPYMFKEFVPNDRLVLTAFQEHPTKAFINELVLRSVPEATARVNGLRGGELDVISTVSVDQAEQLKAANMVIVPFTQGRSSGAWMDTTIPEYPTYKKEVRQALNYAIDKDAIVKNILKGYTKPEQGQIIQSDTFGFNPQIKPYPYDPAKARSLLSVAGYPNGFRVKMEVTTSVTGNDQVFLFVQQQLREVGVETDLQLYNDSAAYLDRFYARVQRPPIMSTTVVNSPSMDADFAYVWFSGKRTTPERLYANPTFDKLYDASTVEMNETRRRELLQQAGEAFYEDPPHLFLTEAFTLWAVRPGISGVVARGDQEPAFEFAK